ncbi:MAG: M48 family metallopeptidase [Candidatus Azobacteroides sp.]|nr:M48 family metallopeptidase [Candidatus Azobacteroides sp.]
MAEIIKIVNDSQVGEVVFYLNPNAKQYIIRIKRNIKDIEKRFYVRVTIPLGGSYQFAGKFFQKHRLLILQKIDQLKSNVPPPIHEQESELRQKAEAFLPGELERISKTYGLTYKKLKIRKSKTRWGSCSSKQSISLSFYLVLLPRHLIEYVLLHELCHTIEMNHSSAFWSLLDRYTDGRSKQLKRELSNYRIPAF